MLSRFCLYGFLKNQQYWVPFLLLCFRSKGLSFTQIGLLVSVREIVVNLFEVPSGVLADIYGRRRAMIFSFSAYVLSFALLGHGKGFGSLAVAMACFGLGDAFRTGTHKAMIMSWLDAQGRLDEKTKIYGLTRSWSRLGSALSALVAAGLVFSTQDYAAIFWWSIPPYLLGIVNFLGYPAWLDGKHPERAGPSAHPSLFTFLGDRAREMVSQVRLRRVLLESCLADGYHGASKDYLQAALQMAALTLPIGLALPSKGRAALMVGAVYFVFHLLESAASRNAHRLTPEGQGEDQAARRLWQARLLFHGILTVALLHGGAWSAILAFVALGILQNVWRPLQVSRMQSEASSQGRATLLSVESQGKALSTMLLAPLLGFAVDHCGLWAVGALGAMLAALPLFLAPAPGAPLPSAS